MTDVATSGAGELLDLFADRKLAVAAGHAGHLVFALAHRGLLWIWFGR
jgi:hypothetical protein